MNEVSKTVYFVDAEEKPLFTSVYMEGLEPPGKALGFSLWTEGFSSDSFGGAEYINRPFTTVVQHDSALEPICPGHNPHFSIPPSITAGEIV